MNDITNFLGFAGYVVAVVSGVFAFVNRDRYKTLINDIYEPGNQELREQLTTARERDKELIQENATLKAQLAEKESRIKDLKELNANLPDYTELASRTNDVITVLSNNHKETMKRLTELAKVVAKKDPSGEK